MVSVIYRKLANNALMSWFYRGYDVIGEAVPGAAVAAGAP